jgi:hypothetical protein
MTLMQDVETYLETLTGHERALMKRLRTMILQAEPRINETLSYGVPYFSRHRRLFYLRPSSAIPGKPQTESDPSPKVMLGFCYGNLLSNDQGLLIREERKQVFTIPVFTLTAAKERLISEVINEAVYVDEQFFGRK